MVVPRTKMSALSESDRCAPVTSVAPLPQHVQSRDSLFFLVSGTLLISRSLFSWYPIDLEVSRSSRGLWGEGAESSPRKLM